MARPKLRKPFVVTTVALGTAAFACSSSTSSTSSSSSSGGTPEGGVAVTTNPPGVVDCPTVKPIEGSSCPENGVTCDYGADASCGDPATTGTITCEVGLWVSKSTPTPCDSGTTDASDDAADADAGD